MLLLIANDCPLGLEWRDHQLSGNFAGHRECHIGGDFLLADKLDESGKHGLVGSTANTVGLVNRPWNCWTLNTSGFRSSGGAIEPDSHESRHPLGARSPSCAQTRITPKKWHSSEEVQLVLM